MSSPERRGDRSDVFERDGYTCRNCGDGGGDEATARSYPVGDVPLEEPVHASALVTVCSDCLETLRASPEAREGGDLFAVVREITRTQGAAISDVAGFASAATSLPPLSEGDDPGPEYARNRRDVLLAIAVVDARIESLEAVETGTLDPAVRSALSTFTATATALQADLREVIALGETVVAGLERCHGCFDALEGTNGGSCPTCGLEAPDTRAWRRADGAFAFESLFSRIDDALRGSAETTEALTEQTTTLAEALVAD